MLAPFSDHSSKCALLEVAELETKVLRSPLERMNVESSPVELPRIVRANRVESGDREVARISAENVCSARIFPIASNLYNVLPKLA